MSKKKLEQSVEHMPYLFKLLSEFNPGSRPSGLNACFAFRNSRFYPQHCVVSWALPDVNPEPRTWLASEHLQLWPLSPEKGGRESRIKCKRQDYMSDRGVCGVDRKGGAIQENWMRHFEWRSSSWQLEMYDKIYWGAEQNCESSELFSCGHMFKHVPFSGLGVSHWPVFHRNLWARDLTMPYGK